MSFYGISLGRVKRTEVLLLERVVELVHEVLELYVRLPHIWQKIILENSWLTDFANSLVLPRVIADKVLFSSIGHSAIISRRPPDDAVLVNMDFGPILLFEDFDEIRRFELVGVFELLRISATNVFLTPKNERWGC